MLLATMYSLGSASLSGKPSSAVGGSFAAHQICCSLKREYPNISSLALMLLMNGKFSKARLGSRWRNVPVMDHVSPSGRLAGNQR